MGLLNRIRCFFSPRDSCVLWDADQDETIRYMRSEKLASEESTDRLRRRRAGWFEEAMFPHGPCNDTDAPS